MFLEVFDISPLLGAPRSRLCEGPTADFMRRLWHDTAPLSEDTQAGRTLHRMPPRTSRSRHPSEQEHGPQTPSCPHTPSAAERSSSTLSAQNRTSRHEPHRGLPGSREARAPSAGRTNCAWPQSQRLLAEWGRRGSNPDGPCGPGDFKSPASTNSATPPCEESLLQPGQISGQRRLATSEKA